MVVVISVASMNFARKPELPYYEYSSWIAEFWNTTSNIIFFVLGMARYYDSRQTNMKRRANPQKPNPMPTLWLLMAAAGVCSAFHHSQTMRWTIVVDWIPIGGNILYVLVYHRYLLNYVSVAAWCGFAFAMSMLVVDHVATLLPVPWGHVMWHVAAAYSITSAFQDMDRFFARVLPD